MSDEEKTPRREEGKEPYEKPSLAAIDLTADQVLGFGCKTMAGTTSLQSNGLCLACADVGS